MKLYSLFYVSFLCSNFSQVQLFKLLYEFDFSNIGGFSFWLGRKFAYNYEFILSAKDCLYDCLKIRLYSFEFFSMRFILYKYKQI